jgi:serine/threonine protein kinase
MAPEIIIGKGYSFQVDYWSLGVILYELLFGTVPFGHDQDDPYYIYESILQRRLVFSNSIRTTQRVQDLIEQLLSLNPVVRNGGSGERLKQNSWFSGLDWDTVYSKEINPPHIPQISEIETDSLRNSCTLEQAILSECTALQY